MPRWQQLQKLAEETPEWFRRAKCSGVDPSLFFPDVTDAPQQTAAEAKKVCAGCPVKEPCLEYALANREAWGVWGETSERERRKIRARRKLAAATEAERVRVAAKKAAQQQKKAAQRQKEQEKERARRKQERAEAKRQADEKQTKLVAKFQQEQVAKRASAPRQASRQRPKRAS